VRKQIELPAVVADNDEVVADEEEDEAAVAVLTEVEETKVITKLEMSSRRLKVKISNELLVALERMQIKFKLN
jgi:DNA polymerase-3 subunit alpha